MNEEYNHTNIFSNNDTVCREILMSIKRSELLRKLKSTLHVDNASEVLAIIEKYMEPRIRPLTDKEVDEHVLVKQVHHSRKDEVRNYVRNLDYEWKREYIPEDD